MKKCLLSALLCVFAFVSFSQQTDTIVIKKSFGGLSFVKDGNTHPMGELKDMVATNADAVQFASKANSLNITASIFGGVAGGLIGWTLGTYYGGGEPEWSLVAIGAGSFVVGLVFDSYAKKNARKAVEIYNNGLKAPASTSFNPELGIGLTGNGVGLTLRF
jgi:hypothetical protein